MPETNKLAEIFLREHRGSPLLLEEKAAYGDYGRPAEPKTGAGIAVIPVTGMLTEASGWYGSTYSEIRRQVSAAVDDPSTKGILLKVNSPGGSTDKAFETADFLAAAGKKKPIWAVCDANCYSAAYLLASQAAKIYVAPTSGGAGSIGVYAAHVDYSGMLEKEGIAVTLISAGRGKTDGNPYEPLSDTAKGKIQADVDRLYGEFVAAVSRGRKIDEKEVRKLGADLYPEQKALDAGLADAIGTYDQALAVMAARFNPNNFSAAASAAANSTKEVSRMEENQTAGATAAAEDPKPAPVTAKPAADPAAEAYKAAAKVVRLCGVARVKPEAFVDMLAKGASMEAVQEAIINAKAEAAGAEISTANPAVEPDDKKSKSGENSPLLVAMAARGGQKGAK